MLESSCNLVSNTIPTFTSFHVHVCFNGTNYEESLSAVNLHSSFINYYNNYLSNNTITMESMKECPFPHPKGYNPNFNIVCYFPFNATMNAFPFPNNDPIFGTENYAFYIPKVNDLYINIQSWFQHNHGNISYLFHANTGCEANDHTKWALFGYKYKFSSVHIPALMCCQYGPPSICYCNITMYQLNLNNNNINSHLNGYYLTVSNDINNNQLLLINNTIANTNHYDFQLQWRETLYTSNFPQLENFGQPDYHSYRCIGIINNNTDINDDNLCGVGAKVGIIDCYQKNLQSNLFGFDFEYNMIRAYNCTKENLCLKLQMNEKNSDNSTYSWALADCSQATMFTRYWLS